MAKKTKKKKVAIYIRVSTVEQSENDFSSLDGQESQCKAWINNRNQIESKDYEIHEIYKDMKSGKDLKRPGIKRLQKDAKDGEFDLLVVTKLDRVSRSLHDFLKLVSELDEHGVNIAVVTQQIDTSTPAGKALQRLLLVFAEFERDMNSQRTKEKMLESAKQGRWQGGYPPLGYDVGDKKVLQINEKEAEEVKEVYNRYFELKSSTKVAQSLNKDGYTTKDWVTSKGEPRGGDKYESRQILRILKSQVYLGKIEHNDDVFEGKHDPIIEQETFDKAQEVLESNRIKPKKYDKTDTPAVLTSVAECGLCDSSLTTTSTKKSSGKKYYYYKCLKKNREGNTKGHAPKPLSVPSLDNFVFNTFKLLFEEPEILKAVKKRSKFEGESQIEKLEKKIKRLNQQIKSTSKDITKTKKLLTKDAGDRSEEILLEQLENLALKKEEHEDELEFCTSEKKRLSDQKTIDTKSYQKILKHFIEEWENGDPDKREDHIKALVRRVTSNVDRDKTGMIEVEYIADKKLEAEWPKIEKCESGSEKSLPVRTSSFNGSPGRIRTYDRSVNSRLLCR
ncbi:site-specific DNA recombinase [Fodinibius salinus]|uniref:Site-specific DNA recombinase n=1 Tax=Fodinibius salinus TaxID=860790 RepID=A0A5D3YL32_9BACT|nr:site-specific DNA recombinase [Fodinibius salinus]